MLSSDFLFPRFFVVPLANPSNFSHCKCFSSRIEPASVRTPIYYHIKSFFCTIKIIIFYWFYNYNIEHLRYDPKIISFLDKAGTGEALIFPGLDPGRLLWLQDRRGGPT